MAGPDEDLNNPENMTTPQLVSAVVSALGRLALDPSVPARDRIKAAEAYLMSRQGRSGTVDRDRDPGTMTLEEIEAELSD